MRFQSSLAALLSVASLATAIPAAEPQESSKAGLRLIKTSEADPGVWVSEEDKISQYRAKHINFIDITDIKDPETLDRLTFTIAITALPTEHSPALGSLTRLNPWHRPTRPSSSHSSATPTLNPALSLASLAPVPISLLWGPISIQPEARRQHEAQEPTTMARGSLSLWRLCAY
ncbi:MAG: hypothetical protein Q9211_004534 [Gyalolechia sp. 1 TL-2023]